MLRVVVLSRLERHQPVLWNLILVGLLPCISGAVNASGFFIVGSYTSHVTGNVARIGDELAQGNYELVRGFGWIVAFFFFGAMSSTLLLRFTREWNKARHAPALIGQAAALLIVTLIGLIRGPQANLEGFFSLSLLSFAMGMQNAMFTTLQGARVRTTHITGVVTDLGIDTVQVMIRAIEELRAAGPFAIPHAIAQVWRDQELTRFRIHLGIVFSFSLGAVVGPYAYLHLGVISMLLPVIALSVLAAIDCLPPKLVEGTKPLFAPAIASTEGTVQRP